MLLGWRVRQVNRFTAEANVSAPTLSFHKHLNLLSYCPASTWLRCFFGKLQSCILKFLCEQCLLLCGKPDNTFSQVVNLLQTLLEKEREMHCVNTHTKSDNCCCHVLFCAYHLSDRTWSCFFFPNSEK